MVVTTIVDNRRRPNGARWMLPAIAWSLSLISSAGLNAQQATPAVQQTTPAALPVTNVATPAPPPQAQAYVVAEPGAREVAGRTLVPLSFLSNGLGASVGKLGEGAWRITYFNHTADITLGQTAAVLDKQPAALQVEPQTLEGTIYVPWSQLADLFEIQWSIVTPVGASTPPANGGASPVATPAGKPAKTTFLLQYPAAYIQNVQASLAGDKLRVVLTLSNPTRIVAVQQGLDAQFHLAAARRPGIPDVIPINDYLVPRVVTRSGDWQANTIVRMNYSAPVQWYTLGNPPRVVIDVQRLFEQRDIDALSGGISITRIRRGTDHGPVQMFLARFDPEDGWRMRVAPGGYSVMQRARPSRLASRHKALVAINGGFFAYEGAAVGAVKIDGEWLRLPWKGRTAIGFRPDGRARIGSLQVSASATFSSGWRFPVRDLNGWPAHNQITALTRRFGNAYPLHPGEMAVIVKRGKVVSTPGSGKVEIPANGFVLIAQGGAYKWLNNVARGQRAVLEITAPGWKGYSSALGGGPRLLRDGNVEVTALQEQFRSDVREGRGPRTAIGLDDQGRYLVLVVDGRKPYYSTGLTLTELAYTLLQFGAVDALNLDGGGSTVIAVRGKVINRPSDGNERSVSNALLVMR